MTEAKKNKILGYCMLIPRLLVMIATVIYLGFAFQIGNVFIIISGIILGITYGFDVIYLLFILIRARVTGNDEQLNEEFREIDEAMEAEMNLFNIDDDKKDE